MKKLILIVITAVITCSGCQIMRPLASEKMKQNAYLHSQTTQLAADIADTENTSKKLQQLTRLSAKQSLAFIADTGLPVVAPESMAVENILSQNSSDIADAAIRDAGDRVDIWQMADGVIDFGIAVGALFGGAGAAAVIAKLKKARQKTLALKEIVQGNELFKTLNPQEKNRFKQAHTGQSSDTKVIVSELKSV